MDRDSDACNEHFFTLCLRRQDPDDVSACVDIIHCALCAVVTSGDYKRYYEVGGVRYHHIISPDTLYLARGIRSVTVVTGDAMNADFLPTALFILNDEDGSGLLERVSGAEAYRITEAGSIIVPMGMQTMLAQ
ncbi:MAG: hypothetical protein CW338_11700 [Clostridiales bacterium]|nr:hypothetical protein [Clostridiales bacterium]